MATPDRPGRDERLIAALAGGMTQAAAAEAAGVSERTVRRRLEDAGFCARVADAAADQGDRISRRLDALADGAIDALSELVGPRVEPAVRLKAATAVLDAGERARVSVRREARLPESAHRGDLDKSILELVAEMDQEAA